MHQLTTRDASPEFHIAKGTVSDPSMQIALALAPAPATQTLRIGEGFAFGLVLIAFGFLLARLRRR